MNFEWDTQKAVSNKRKHGISFDDAADALRDPDIVEDLDVNDDYDEDRMIAYAKLDGQILVIIYTLRDDIFRIISARRAEKHERKHYESENRT
jgi:uncharacterized DUF497 family protein